MMRRSLGTILSVVVVTLLGIVVAHILGVPPHSLWRILIPALAGLMGAIAFVLLTRPPRRR